jgi:hypothetical protein
VFLSLSTILIFDDFRIIPTEGYFLFFIRFFH